jgi:hypothetical protein
VTAVAIPERFGSRRFGKVSGSVLETDGKEYPQPGGTEVWEPGSTFLAAPPWADPQAELYGFRPNALISGGTQHVYGQAVDGWLYADPVNGVMWLIQPQLGTATSNFDSTLSIDFKVRRFGLFSSAGTTGYPVTTVTATLADWGQATPDITEYGDCTHAVDAAVLHLVSAKKDGSVAILMASLRTDHPFNEMPWLHNWPVGFLGVTCAAVAGATPTLTLSVLRDRATTLGERTDMTVTGTLTVDTVCDTCSYSEGTEEFTQGVTDAIVALFYDDDTLTEMTASSEIAGSNVCEEPYLEDEIWYQDSNGSISVSWTVKCNDREVTWAYTLTDAMHSQVNCDGGTKTSSWTVDRTESFNGREETTTTTGSRTTPCNLEHTDAETGTFIFMVSTACRGSGDLWEDHFAFASEYHNWGFWRYAYNVVGLYCEIDGDPVRGDALTPAAIIPAASVGTGYYGAFNARTGDGVAGESDPVGYV